MVFDMIELLVTVVVISLSIVGLYAATLNGMILYRPAQWLKGHLPLWVWKPVGGCMICMASVWSVVAWGLGACCIVELPVVVLMVAGLNALFYRITGFSEFTD
jgi:hypothetical protein